MWFVTNNIDSHSIEWELIMFINIRVLRLRCTDWKSSLILLCYTRVGGGSFFRVFVSNIFRDEIRVFSLTCFVALFIS